MSDSEAMVRDELFDDLLGDFLDESGQLLDQLNENLLQLDEWVQALDEDHQQRCDEDLLNEMFRSAHSLKGLSGMLGLGDINNLTHKIENVFDAARKEELIVSGDVVEMMFQGIDRLVGLVGVLKDSDAEEVECESVIQGIAELLQSAGVERNQSSQADAERALADAVDELAEQLPPVPEVTAEKEPAPAPTPAVAHVVDHFDGLEDETEVPSKYLSIFIDEAEIALDKLTETLLALEGGGSPGELKKLLITSHQIKGSAASVGLNRAAKLSHLMEDLLQDLVDSGGTLSHNVTEAMLNCIDALRRYTHDLKSGGAHSDAFSNLARELLTALSGAPCPDETTPQPQASATETDPGTTAQPTGERAATAPTGLSTEIRSQIAAIVPDGLLGYVGEVKFRPNLPMVGLKAQLIYEKLDHLGKICYFDPPPETLEDLDHLDGVRFGLASDRSGETIGQQLRISGVQEATVESLTVEEPGPPTAETASDVSASQPQVAASPAAKRPAKGRPAADTGSRPTETLRVDIDRLDQLMNLAGQLVINKARFSQIGDNLKSVLGAKQSVQKLDRVFDSLNKMTAPQQPDTDKQHLQMELEELQSQARRIQADLETVRREMQMVARSHASIGNLQEAIHQLDRVSDDIQQSVMDTRMVPVGPLFTRFKRVIRDISRSNGKSMRLEIRGEKTELDKRMIDELGDPLIHMVRNSADHGVESPEDRESAGKPREGTVTLDAYHRGNSIIIQVTDDGKGLDSDRILQKCLDKGILNEVEAKNMTPHQIYQMIWEPGLSTAEKVTEVSGRGMGMDIVRSKIEALNGTVDLDSTPGQGTTITIKLPLTLAVLPSLMVDIERDIFAIPMESVLEIVSLGRQDLTTVYGQWTARVRGRVISMVKLNEVFTWSRTKRSAAAPQSDDTTLVIVGESGQEIGLCVDSVLGEEDVVIKSMADNYHNVTGIAGASILGDGRVSLIIDVGTLIDMASNKSTATST